MTYEYGILICLSAEHRVRSHRRNDCAMCSHRLLEFHVNHSENIATVEAPSDKDEAVTFNISQLAGKVAL
jgi:hypothetical protein